MTLPKDTTTLQGSIDDEKLIRVLLIEDDEDDYLLARDYFDDFQSPGRHLLEWVSTYDEGLQALRAEEHHICLLDYRLGAQDGVELLRQSLDEGCRTPIVMLTGSGNRDVDKAAMRHGAADYLVKSEITAALLERSIRHSLERHRFLERQRLLAAENAELYEKARRALESRDEVYRIVAHDLRNPLSTMGLALQLMERQVTKKDLAPAFSRQLKTQRLCIAQMNRLIQDLLDAARLEGGQLSMSRGLHMPEMIVASAFDQHRIQADDRGVTLTSHVDQGLPRIDGDARRIDQVLGNLISNALKFTPEQGRIEIAARADDRNFVCFSVTDTGQGIRQEDLPHLFDRFWQSDDSDRGGAGLGLAICKGIVDAHGGRIWVDSTLGEGTTFYFTIPTEES